MFATALLVVSPTFVAVSQEARSYALTLFLVALASFLFVRGIQRSSPGVWIAYVAAGGLSVYSHFFAGLVLVAHLCCVPFVPGPTARR